MNRALQCFNLLGVIALAVLCTLQWRTNRTVNRQANELEKIHQEQTVKLADQDQALQGSAADLEHFREQLTRANAVVKENEARLKTTEREIAQLNNERDQLKSSVTHWADAVAVRDERLQEATAQLQTLAADRNDALQKFNDLAGKYNAVVSDLHARTTNYNALVERFNALAQPAKTNASR